jgi:hypothetical protein
VEADTVWEPFGRHGIQMLAHVMFQPVIIVAVLFKQKKRVRCEWHQSGSIPVHVQTNLLPDVHHKLKVVPHAMLVCDVLKERVWGFLVKSRFFNTANETKTLRTD